MSAPAAIDAISEAEFQKQFCELAETLGWRWCHVRKSIGGKKQGWVTSTSVKGWPDLYLWHERLRRSAFVEVKKQDGRLQPEQRALHASLRAAGLDVRVIRPSDLDDAAQWLRGPLPRNGGWT